MEAANGEGEEQGGAPRSRLAAAPVLGQGGALRPMPMSTETRGHGLVPGETAGQLHRRHADIMHGADAAPMMAPARPAAASAAQRRPAGAGDQDRRGDREQGEPKVVADRQVRPIGEHGDEMGRPDAGAGDEAGQRHPRPPPCGAPRLLEDRESGEGGEQADDAGDEHQPEIMLLTMQA